MDTTNSFMYDDLTEPLSEDMDALLAPFLAFTEQAGRNDHELADEEIQRLQQRIAPCCTLFTIICKLLDPKPINQTEINQNINN
jgi:hypothetical protein